MRERIRIKFGGRCAYCGKELPHSWHIDHFKPIHRIHRWDKERGRYVATGVVEHPERDTEANKYPACPPCNISKGSHEIEAWRNKLMRHVEMLNRDSSTYRLAVRFGTVEETGHLIKFWYEHYGLND